MTAPQLQRALERHRSKLDSGNWGLYFHGAAEAFETVDFSRCGAGKDANCALGLFVTSSPADAAKYAEFVREIKHGAVMLALVELSRPYEFDNFETFYGADYPQGNPTHDRKHFERSRLELLQQGHDSAWFVLEDDGVIGIALDSQHVVLLGSMTTAQAHQLEESGLFNFYWDPQNPDDKSTVLQAALAILHPEHEPL